MIGKKVSGIRERIFKKYRRDGLQRLLEAGIITATIKLTSPVPDIFIENLLTNKIRIATRDVLKNSDIIDVFEFSQPEITKIHQQHSIKNHSTSPKIPLETIEWDSPFVAVVPDGKLIGHSAIGYSNQVGILLETTMAWQSLLERDLVKHPLSLARIIKYESAYSKVPNKAHYEEICPLVNLYSNYYHWVQTSLPRLQGLRYYEEQTGREPSLLIRSNPPAWVRDWLTFLGFSDERIIEWDRKFAIADRLIIPAYPRLEINRHRREYEGATHLLARPCACKWLRAEASQATSAPKGFSSNVYISRDDAYSRRVINEKKLMDELVSHGFEKYILSELSVEEQVNLFANAEKIVAPHGAGLVNVMFVSDCHVIELSPPPLRPTFFMLSNTLDLKYTYHPCESRGEHMNVDVSSLLDLISSIDSTK